MEDLLNRTDEELLEHIGRSLAPESLEMFPRVPTREELRERARAWLAEAHLSLQTMLCANESLRALDRSPERELVFHAICEVLTGVMTGVHVGAVSAYVVKRGLHTLCRDVWA